MIYRLIFTVLLFQLWLSSAPAQALRPYTENPWYWQYNGEPVLLLGGSQEDNLFQFPELETHLDLIRSVGGNYIRNTMSSRDEGDEQPFRRLGNGQYDLDEWNEEYWRRFDRLLAETAERNIFVQIEIWDKWDVAPERWDKSPWYPDNNVNYSFEDTKLKSGYKEFHLEAHDFFNSIPELHDDRALLQYQRAFVDKMLSYSLRYDHVLYSIDNELHGTFSEKWSLYWARYIRRRALENGTPIHITEMYWSPELRAKDHKVVLNNPELFSFFEASQNTSNKTPWQHWRNLQWLRYALQEAPRPINIVKIYSQRDGADRMWRQIIGGAATSRFHRPPGGLGLNEEAQTHLKSLRMWLEAYDIFTGRPDGSQSYGGGHSLLTDRDWEEAYCNYREGRQYAVYFRDGGEVGLKTPPGQWALRWLDISRSRWLDSKTVASEGEIRLKTPGEGYWLALLSRVGEE